MESLSFAFFQARKRQLGDQWKGSERGEGERGEGEREREGERE